MKTKIKYYVVGEYETAQGIVVAATEAVRDSRCDALFVDCFTNDMIKERLEQLASHCGEVITKHDRQICIAGKPVYVLPVIAANLLAKLRELKRVAILTAE